MTFKQYLNIDANAKTVKGQKKGYMTGVLYLAPYNLSGKNVCPFASKDCSADCLNTAGRGAFSNVQQARLAKTKAFWADTQAFCNHIEKNIHSLITKAQKAGFKPCVRLNGTSDIAWEKYGIIQKFPKLQMYDYTKNPNRMMEYLEGKMPKNYHLTFSLSENNLHHAMNVLSMGGNVAMVFNTKKGKALPKTYYGYKVIDGDESDLRFLDKRGVIVGLRAKGKARKSVGGFVQDASKKPVYMIRISENRKVA